MQSPPAAFNPLHIFDAFSADATSGAPAREKSRGTRAATGPPTWCMSVVLLRRLAGTSGLSTEDLNQPFARRRRWNIVACCRLNFREGVFTNKTN
jgi:hypothetical protein